MKKKNSPDQKGTTWKSGKSSYIELQKALFPPDKKVGGRVRARAISKKKGNARGGEPAVSGSIEIKTTTTIERVYLSPPNTV